MEGESGMHKKILLHEVQSSRAFFEHVLSVFTEEDSNFAPFPGGFTVAQQVAHTAQTLLWLIEGAESPDGFDMEFEAHYREVVAVKSLEQAKRMLAENHAKVLAWIENSSEEDLLQPIAAGPIMPGEPRLKVLWGVVDHSAHHRGALTVYARALGRTAPMPYEAVIPWPE
jgi:uncharacterized damage-inducible protein DinB